MKTPRSLPSHFDFQEFESHDASRQRALFLDYDGTLADFHVDRKKAMPSVEVFNLLVQLSSITRGRVAIISGRSVQDLRSLLGEQIDIEMWGDYGWERWRPGDGVTIWKAPKKDIVIFMKAAALAAPYVDRQNLEIKTASIAVHTRALSDLARREISAAITKVWSPLAVEHHLQLLPFNGGYELRDVLRTKGTAVRELRTELSPDAHICYIGDDVADEDAFLEVDSSDWSILVAPVRRPSYARFWLRPSADVIRFLQNWIQWEGGSHAAFRLSKQRSSRLG
jgi:trehalose 6-phosphate phosphatase